MRARPLVSVAGLTGVVLIWLGLEWASLPSSSAMAELARSKPTTTALIELRREAAEEEGRRWRPSRSWLSLGAISDELEHAVVVAEDAGFYGHNGVDFAELWIALKEAVADGQELRGASTITQQLAKNLYLNPRRTPLRKLEEMLIARRLEKALSKGRILELYLNVIEWGPSVFGCEAAAQHWYAKSCAALTRSEAVHLAAVIPSPLRHNPRDGTSFTTRRAERIEERMRLRGW